MDRPVCFDRRAVVASVALGAALGGPKAVAAPQAPWASQGFVQRMGGRMRWAALGEGPPVVVLHKLGGWLADWNAIAPLLANGRRVVALDLPGHGDSVFTGPAPWVVSLVESAGIVRATLDDLGIDRCVVVGNSLGGCVGVVMAALWPQSVERLALLSVALSEGRTRAAVAAEDRANDRFYDAAGRPLPRSAADVSRFGSSAAVVAEQNRSRAKAGVWVRPSQRGVSLAGVADYLPRVSAPTLLMYAGADAYAAYEAVGRARLRDVRSVSIAGSGAFMHQERPAETAAALAPFLDGAG